MEVVVLLLIPVFIIGVTYVAIIQPNNKNKKLQLNFQDALQVGNKVITTAGIYGEILEINTDTIILKMVDNTKIKFAREAIVRMQTSEKEITKKESVSGKDE